MSNHLQLHHISGGQFQLKGVPVVQEAPLTLYVNGQELLALLCTQSKLEALVIGFLACEGIFQGLEDVRSLMVEDLFGYADVRLTSDFAPHGATCSPLAAGAGSRSPWRRTVRPPGATTPTCMAIRNGSSPSRPTPVLSSKVSE